MDQKILVIQTAFLGDLLLSIALLKNIKIEFPKSRTTLVCREGFGDLIRSLGFADEVIEINKKSKDSIAQAHLRLKGARFEYVFCPHQSLSSARLVTLVQSKNKIGFKSWWNRSVFNKRIKRNLKWPDAVRQLSLLSCVSDNFQKSLSEYEKGEGIPIWARLEWKPYDRFVDKIVYFAPGSVWNTKRWTEDGYIKLGQALNRLGYRVHLIGAPAEKELCERISKSIPDSQSFAGQPSLFQLVQILNRGHALVTNDNGAMHLGSVAGIPTVAIFGPTVLDQGYQPWNPVARVVEDKSLSCRPCGRHGHQECPIKTHVCMKNISAEVVLAEVKNLLPL